MSKIFTLGCGLVGKFVAKKLAENGNQITVIDLKIPDEVASDPNILTLGGCLFPLYLHASQSFLSGDDVFPKYAKGQTT